MTERSGGDTVGRFIDRRPLAFFAACYLVGLVIGANTSVHVIIWGACCALLLAALVFFRRRVLLFGLALFFGALMISLPFGAEPGLVSDSAHITGRVASNPSRGEGVVSFSMGPAYINGTESPSDVQVFLYYSGDTPELAYGDEISVDGRTWLPSEGGGPGMFDYREYLSRRGIGLGATAYGNTLKVVSGAPTSFLGLSYAANNRLSLIVDQQYAENAPIMKALLLGNRSELPDEIMKDFRTSGIVHVLSLSGLHVSCLAGMINWLLLALRLPRKAAFIISCLIMSAYSFMVGMPVSIIRALIMYALLAGGRAFGKPSDSLTNLSAAFLLITLADPGSIMDVGFILSFSAVLGILCLGRMLTPRPALGSSPAIIKKAASGVFGAFGITLSAQLGTLPAVAHVYNELPTYGILANIICVPLITLSLPMGLIGLIAGLVLPGLGSLIARVADALVGLVVSATGYISSLPMSVVYLPGWNGALIVAYAIAIFLSSPYTRLRAPIKRIFAAALPALCVLSVLLVSFQNTSGLEIIYLDVGQGSGAIVKTSGGSYIVDSGDGSTAADYMLYTGTRVEGAFISHPHADHAGGLNAVFAINPGGDLYLPAGWEDVRPDESVSDVVYQAGLAGWSVEYLSKGDSVRLSDEVEADILHPPTGYSAYDANSISMVMNLKYGGAAALFAGDLPADDEVVAFPDIDVLCVPHHGSADSTSSVMLMLTSPSIAVVSVGRNSYGHPSAEVLDRLVNVGAKVFRTDQCGTITIRLYEDGTAEVDTWRDPAEAA